MGAIQSYLIVLVLIVFIFGTFFLKTYEVSSSSDKQLMGLGSNQNISNNITQMQANLTNILTVDAQVNTGVQNDILSYFGFALAIGSKIIGVIINTFILSISFFQSIINNIQYLPSPFNALAQITGILVTILGIILILKAIAMFMKWEI